MAASGRDIGVAIGIPEPFGSELQAWRERLGDPNALFIVPHVTLLAPTAVPDDQLGEITDHLAEVAAGRTPFRIRLRGSGTFRPLSPVVFVALAMGISSCEVLQAAVRSGPLARPLRFGYHPHVTVAHDIDEEGLDRAGEALADYEASFDVDGFGLYERGDDQMWRELCHFQFGGRSAGLPRKGPSAEDRSAEDRSAEGRSAEGRTPEGSGPEASVPEGSGPESRGTAGRVADSRGADGRAVDGRGGSNKSRSSNGRNARSPA